MRLVLRSLVVTSILLSPAIVSAQGQSGFVQGFGGATFGTTTMDGLFGGGVGATLTPNVELVGEAGYMRDTIPSNGIASLAGLGSSLLGIGLRVPAFYADGGVRLLTSGGPVRGYVEGTAGAARLRARLDLPGNPFGIENIINDALGSVSVTKPLVGIGGGVVIQAGRLFFDGGYRYKRIFTSGGIDVNQIRGAIGVAF